MGVNINTASVSLLKNVAGLNNASATSIVSYREENGKIESRTQIKRSLRLVQKLSNKQLDSCVLKMEKNH